MDEGPVSSDGEKTLRCPTCGARQAPSAECRRCRCDLSLLLATIEHQRALHRRVLRDLRDGRFAEALRTARRRAEVSPDRDAARLLAVCHLFEGNFRAALDLAENQGRAIAYRRTTGPGGPWRSLL